MAMALSNQRIGKLVSLVSIKCGVSAHENISGINIYKRFMPSRNVGADTSKYLVVPKGCFAFNLMHVGRDQKIPVALNDADEEIVVSGAYFVFRVNDEEVLLKEYLYILMSSSEFDRFAWFCTDSSVRGNLDWETFCDIEIALPPIDIQQKYVDVYNAMVANQKAYEQGLDDLKLTCDAYLEKLRRDLPHETIGKDIYLSDIKNQDLRHCVDSVKGISIEKRFIETKADMAGVSLKPYLLVAPDNFAFVTVTSRNGEKISIAHNSTEDTHLVSSSYVVFGVKDKKRIVPAYLNLFFCRAEFDRYSRFNSWGSARETFSWDDMCEVKIPIPDIEIQQSIVNIYNAYLSRREINEKLKTQIKDLCPILIKGSLEEGRKAK